MVFSIDLGVRDIDAGPTQPGRPRPGPLASTPAGPEPAGPGAEDVGTEGAGVVEVEEALTMLARSGPRFQERAVARAGVPFDRAAYLMLRWVGDHGEIRLSDLARVVGIDVSTASRQVKALEEEKLLERSGDDRDRRVSLLRLTPAGEDAMIRLREARREAVAEVLEGWLPEDRAALAALLRRLAGDVVGRCRKESR